MGKFEEAVTEIITAKRHYQGELYKAVELESSDYLLSVAAKIRILDYLIEKLGVIERDNDNAVD